MSTSEKFQRAFDESKAFGNECVKPDEENEQRDRIASFSSEVSSKVTVEVKIKF